MGLRDDPSGLEAMGFTVAMMLDGWRRLAESHGMPFNFDLPRHNATIPACRAVVAARLNGANYRALMRRLRIRQFSGQVIDDPAVIDAAAVAAGINPSDLAQWVAATEVAEALAADMAATRTPSPAGNALDRRLGSWEGGRRYSPPSWEITRVSDGALITAPGLQPYEVYEVVLANLVPEAEIRAAPDDPIALLEWAGEPLATREVAFVMDKSDDEAADALKGSRATEIELESSSFWQL